MKRYFIVADVHGYYDELMKALDNAGFDINCNDHIFVSLGDLLDRGSQPKECLQFVNNLPADRKILIYGNHEELMDSAIARRCFYIHDEHNGTADTARTLTLESADSKVLLSMQTNEDYNTYIKGCITYYETDKSVLVHGWIPCKESWNTTYFNIDNWQEGNWQRARWINGMEAWRQGVKVDGKTIYCGHWHTSFGHCILDKSCEHEFDNNSIFTPFVHDGIVALDACTAYSEFVNCYVVDEENF